MIESTERSHRIRWGSRLGMPGYLGCLVFSVAVTVLAQEWRVGIGCGLSLVLAAIFYPAGLKPLRSGQLWVFVGFLLVPATLFGPSDWIVGGVMLSQQGLVVGTQMVLRAITILVAVAGFTASVSVSELAGLLERVGLKGLGFALGVAFNMLPIIQETGTNAYQALRLRGGFRCQRFRAIRLLLITIIINSLRNADDIVNAAEARAFSTTQARPMSSIIWQRSDLALVSTLLAGMLVLLLA